MKTALEMLKQLEFCLGPRGGVSLGRTDGKCPVCLGWDGSPQGNGETPGRHTKDCELAAILKAGGASGKRFPILGAGFSIPWEKLTPFEQQARDNHDQSLNELARRGGLDPTELWCVMNGEKWNSKKAPPREKCLEIARSLI